MTGTGGPVLRMARPGTADARAGLSGVCTCGSVWVCPQCGARVAEERAAELDRVIRTVADLGGHCTMVTLTMRHRATDELGAMWGALGGAWNGVTSGKQWTEDQRAHGGLLGWTRVVEITLGRNGWHLHVHALLAWAADPWPGMLRTAARMHARWAGRLERAGFDSVRDSGGLDVTPVTMTDRGASDYFTKATREVTGSRTKRGRRGSLTPMGLLTEAVETYRADLLTRWWEFENVSQGRKQLTWSTAAGRDLRALAELGREREDAEIAADDEIAADESVGLTAESWSAILAADLVTDLLEIGEDDGAAGVCAWLTARGLGWTVAELAPVLAGPLHPPRWSDEAHEVRDWGVRPAPWWERVHT